MFLILSPLYVLQSTLIMKHTVSTIALIPNTQSLHTQFIVHSLHVVEHAYHMSMCKSVKITHKINIVWQSVNGCHYNSLIDCKMQFHIHGPYYS